MFPSTCPGGHPVHYEDAQVLQPDGTYTPAVEIGDLYPCLECRDFYVLTVFGFRRATDTECEAAFVKIREVALNELARGNTHFMRASSGTVSE